MEYNIYCDESCHLPHDAFDLMIIGGLSCPKEQAHDLNKAIFDIKQKHDVYKYAEIKWTKVSKSKLSMYKDLVDLFFNEDELRFRAVVALNKKSLNYEHFNLTHDDWYQRIYYLTLREMVSIGNTYNIFVDIKDTKGDEKIQTLKNVLNNAVDFFYSETVSNIQLLRSDQVQLMQLSDLLIGAVSYSNRGLSANSAKIELIKYIESKTKLQLDHSSPRSEQKFNVFRWKPREV